MIKNKTKKKNKQKKTTLKIENKGEFPLPDKEYLQKPYR